MAHGGLTGRPTLGIAVRPLARRAASLQYGGWATTMVLLVDDDDDLLEVLGLLFEHAGIPHLGARSLAEVQALGKRLSEVTTAFLDVNLGSLQPSGVDVARWLHSQGHTMRIAFITGHAADHPLVRAATGEHGEVLSKPVESGVLLKFARGER